MRVMAWMRALAVCVSAETCGRAARAPAGGRARGRQRREEVAYN